MDNAALIFCLREGCLDRFTDPCQSIGADNQDIFNPAVFEAVQDGEPVLGTFVIADFNRQDFLLSFAVDSKDDISRQLFDNPVITDRVMDRIDEQDRINLVKRPVLPFFDLRQELACQSHPR